MYFLINDDNCTKIYICKYFYFFADSCEQRNLNVEDSVYSLFIYIVLP